MKVIEPIQCKYIRQSVFLPVCTAAFFGLYWLYVCLRIEPTLIYHSHGLLLRFPVFSADWAFIESFLSRPGGLVECLFAFLSQFYYYSWAGAMVITLIGWFFYLSIGAFVRAFTGRDVYLLRFVPAVGLLLAYNQYIHCLEGSIKILSALLFALVYIKMPLRRGWMRWTVFLLLSALLYCGAGTGGLLFAWFCGLFEIRRRRFVTALWCFVCATAVAYILANYFLDSLLSRMWLIFPMEQSLDDSRIADITVWSYLAFALPVLVMAFWPWRKIVAAQINGNKADHKNRRFPPIRWYVSFRTSRFKLVFQWLILLIVSATAVFFSFDRSNMVGRRILYYAYYRKWPELLRDAQQVPREKYNMVLNCQIDRALFHTGELTSRLFSYPQRPQGLLGVRPQSHYLIAAELFLELGLVNDAEHLAHESLEIYGSHPMNLKQLALINIAKGQSDTARVFLRAMSRDLVLGRWALDCLERLEKKQLPADERIRRINPFIIVNDRLSVSTFFNVDEILGKLLRHNPKNRMAYEYLMSWYLLTNQLDMFAKNVYRLDDFDYRGIPRHYEEAILCHNAMTGTWINLGNRKISRQTAQRFEDFVAMSITYRNDPQKARKMLVKDFGDTYYYYYSFGHLEEVK